MKFRPCIDIHNGRVKQIVGGSLKDSGNAAAENFVSEKGAGYYARLYRERELPGGHVILLNAAGTEYYEADRQQAFEALAEYPGGLQTGGGVTPENAGEYLERGASHVIVTSYVFREGHIDMARLDKLVRETGREHLVLDLSCRKRDGDYYIVTDRWQKWTDTKVTRENILSLADYCDEFLIHAADAEGKKQGIEESIVRILGSITGVKCVYAGGIGTEEDIEKLGELGGGNVDYTVGSALDLFGGSISFEKIAFRGKR